MQTDDTARYVENASVTLKSGMHVVGEVGGFRVDTDADERLSGADGGPQPLHPLLLGVAGCTAIDVICILRKKRQRISGLEVEARGSQVGGHPKVYRAIEIVYRVRGKRVDPKAVQRATEFSEIRYCPTIAMVGQASRIDSRYEIEETG